MSFHLVYGECDWALPLVLKPAAEKQLVELMSLAASDVEDRVLLSRGITDAICALLDIHAVPPTAKQINYAVAIARELSLPISPEVLQRREAMVKILGTHVEAFQLRRGKV